MVYGVAGYQKHREKLTGNTNDGSLMNCADGLVASKAEFACMTETQLEAQDPPGPDAAVVQSATGDAIGAVRLPRRPETSTNVWFGLNG